MVNLEKFPSNETALKMMSMITGNNFYENSYVGKWLFQVMGMEMENARQLLEELREQIFPETATWAIDYHEQRFAITDNKNLPIEKRREEVVRVRDTKAPINPAKVEKVVSLYTTRDCEVTEIEDSYYFHIEIFFSDDASTDVLDGIFKLINRIKPSHLSYYIFAVMDPTVFKEHNLFKHVEANFHTRIYNFSNTVLLNGWDHLNGTWTLSQQSAKGLDLSVLDFKTWFDNYIYNCECFLAVSARLKNEVVWRYLDFEIKCFLRNTGSIKSPAIKFHVSVENKNTLSGNKLVMDSMYRMDGEVLFDGKRKMNAAIIEEEF